LEIYTYFSKIEKSKYGVVSVLLDKCREDETEIIVSFYSLHELFLLAFKYMKKAQSKIGLESIRTIVNMPIELVPLLDREKRLKYYKKFKITDRTDIPHAITAFIHNCDCIVTYDSHFNEISEYISVKTPEEIIEKGQKQILMILLLLLCNRFCT
jgi:predicted nucleic acid-binding protein